MGNSLSHESMLSLLGKKMFHWMKKVTKKRMFIIILIIVCSFIFYFVFDFSYAELSIKVSRVEKVENPIKLLTYNVFQYWDEITSTLNQDSVLEVLQKTGADIIGLQEAFGNRINGTVVGASWLASQLGMNHFESTTSEDHLHGVTLLSRWPIIKQNHTLLREENVSRFSRVVIQVTIDSPHGELLVLNTHLDTPPRYGNQIQQVSEIIRMTRQVSQVIIIGDFNVIDTILYDPYYRLTTAFSDAWIAAGKLAIEGRTWPSSLPLLRVDYIWLAGANWNVARSNAKLVGNSSISDHLGVYVEVEMTNGAKKTVSCIINKNVPLNTEIRMLYREKNGCLDFEKKINHDEHFNRRIEPNYGK